MRAVELERRFDKAAILDLYLTLAPFGGNLEGVRAASFAYFGKEPKRLSTAEAALLVALPQSPETRRPDRFPEAARKARDRVLARVEQAGLATADEVAAAREEPIPTARRPFPNLSPHVAEQVVAEAPHLRSHRLSIDARLQASLEEPRPRAQPRAQRPRSRSPSSRSTTRPARSGPRSAASIISLPSAPARST